MGCSRCAGDLHDRQHQNLTIAAKFQWLEKSPVAGSFAVAFAVSAVMGLGLVVRFCADGFEFTGFGRE